MQTTALATGIAGFLLGGLVVSTAATAFGDDGSGAGTSMSQMTEELRDREGAAYDEAFLAAMIEHHQGAIDMAELSAERAEHPEIKQLSREIIAAQQEEIATMQEWQEEWGYRGGTGAHDGH